MAHVYLVADTRERHVHPFIETVFGEAGAGRHVAQINTGDYLVCQRRPGEEAAILACVERKTLKDFAASFADGRYENRNKMLDLRDRTGCQLYFFVEGPAFPKPAWKVGRVPYGNILGAMTSMMIRDGIHVVQTENEAGTAQRLLDFVRAFGRTEVPYEYPRRGGGGAAPPAAAPGADVPPLVLGAVERSDDLLVADVWARLSGISLPTARTLAAAWTVADLVEGRAAPADLAALRTAGGRALARRGRASLDALRRDCPKEAAKVLSGVPGVSPATAAQLLGAGGLRALLARGAAALAAAPLQQKGRAVRLGAARAARILRLLTYRIAPGGPAAPGGGGGAPEGDGGGSEEDDDGGPGGDDGGGSEEDDDDGGPGGDPEGLGLGGALEGLGLTDGDLDDLLGGR